MGCRADRLSESQISEAVLNTSSMGAAAVRCGVSLRTFKKYAEPLGLYRPAGKRNLRFSLEDILAGKHPQYPTYKLSRRLVKEGLKEYRCERCGIEDWQGASIGLELNHKDGNGRNHELSNLEMLCPNCHSQTPTYRSKKRTFRKGGRAV